jgi:hypothetical protein
VVPKQREVLDSFLKTGSIEKEAKNKVKRN